MSEPRAAKRLLPVLTGLAILLSACNMPGAGGRQEGGAGAIYTAAAQTLAVQMTQVNQPPASPAFISTWTPQAGQGTPPNLTVTVPTAASATAAPGTSTPGPAACDQARFVRDVTIPDNTEMDPNESFVKTWRLENTGSCTWNTTYSVVFNGGDALGAPSAQPLPANVPPGGSVDISITLTAPPGSGTYRADFKLRNASNTVFGIGGDAKPFWVQIKVGGAGGLLFDFLVNAPDAEWTTAAGTDTASLTFDGTDYDPSGVAKIKDAVKLETGATSGKILLTIPRHDPNGKISGLFPVHTVQAGDRLRARIGFMMALPGGTSCGAARARFQIAYRESGGELILLREWTKSCSGSLELIDIDLASLRGKSVQFALIVLADGDVSDDWAIWNSPRIER